MLRISKMADYATLMMVHCGLSSEYSLSASDIARETHLNLPTVSKLLKKLCRAGLLTSQRGVQGGYRLAVSASSISVATIVAAIDGGVALTECSAARHCDLESHCATRRGWHLINQAVSDALSRVFLVDMMAMATTKPKELN